LICQLRRATLPSGGRHLGEIAVNFIHMMLIFAASMLTYPVKAADIFLTDLSSYSVINIEGAIEPGDYTRFISLVEQGSGNVSSVIVRSPGGDFLESLRIGRALRSLQISSLAPMQGPDGEPVCNDTLPTEKPRDPANCTLASAAFFIHVGATFRGGTYLAVHRPIFDPSLFGQLSEADAVRAYRELAEMSREYLTEMGVPNFIIEEVMNTPSDRIRVLSEDLVRTHFWGHTAARGEWLRARCNTFSALEEAEYARLTEQFRRMGTQTPDDIFHRYLAFSDRYSGDRDCMISIGRSLRQAAFNDFFATAETITPEAE